MHKLMSIIYHPKKKEEEESFIEQKPGHPAAAVAYDDLKWATLNLQPQGRPVGRMWYELKCGD